MLTKLQLRKKKETKRLGELPCQGLQGSQATDEPTQEAFYQLCLS